MNCIQFVMKVYKKYYNTFETFTGAATNILKKKMHRTQIAHCMY